MMSEHKPEKVITAEQVLADAQPEGSPLHEMFDWGDKTESGHFKRLLRVEDVFENLMAVLDDGSQVPAYVRAESADGWVRNPEAPDADSPP